MYDELVKSLRNVADNSHYTSPELLSDAADAIENTSKAYQMMAEAYEAQVTKQEWIPVTEKPPLKVGDDGYNGYLVYANGYYAVADYTTDKIDDVPYFYMDGEYDPDVTHWMPLPEPPKEETE